jgi:hypothetical protein
MPDHEGGARVGRVAAAQYLPGGGTLLGGGSQVYIPNVNPDWLLP